MQLAELRTQHSKLFGNSPDLRYFFAPGRVNLIGEHTDYNGGHVFPAALDLGTYAVVSPRTDQTIKLYSSNFAHMGVIEFSLEFPLMPDPHHGWANYPKGMCKIFMDNGYTPTHGLDIYIQGNIPNGAGLSSSASIEMLMATILNLMYNFNLSPLTLVKWGQMVENHFIGVACGIMDQFASMMGKKNHAILLDCNTLNYDYAPVNLEQHSIIIANTNKQRGLADSKYNERRSECETALAQLQQKLAISSLGELDIETFYQYQDLITNSTHRQRAKHAVSENIRTLEAVKALNTNNLSLFGKLMQQSHTSLRDDYAVSGHELDSLVEAAWQQAGCIGSRMTGAGFGGCTVSIVKHDAVDEFISNVGKLYLEKTGLSAEFYTANISDGAKEITV